MTLENRSGSSVRVTPASGTTASLGTMVSLHHDLASTAERQ